MKVIGGGECGKYICQNGKVFFFFFFYKKVVGNVIKEKESYLLLKD